MVQQTVTGVGTIFKENPKIWEIIGFSFAYITQQFPKYFLWGGRIHKFYKLSSSSFCSHVQEFIEKCNFSHLNFPLHLPVLPKPLQFRLLLHSNNGKVRIWLDETIRLFLWIINKVVYLKWNLHTIRSFFLKPLGLRSTEFSKFTRKFEKL